MVPLKADLDKKQDAIRAQNVKDAKEAMNG